MVRGSSRSGVAPSGLDTEHGASASVRKAEPEAGTAGLSNSREGNSGNTSGSLTKTFNGQVGLRRSREGEIRHHHEHDGDIRTIVGGAQVGEATGGKDGIGAVQTLVSSVLRQWRRKYA